MRIPGMEHFCFGGSPSIVRMDVVTPCQHSEMEIRFHERLRSRKDVSIASRNLERRSAA